MLITLFTSIPAPGTEPDLGLFGCEGDDVSNRKSMSWKGSTHGYSPFFLVFNFKKTRSWTHPVTGSPQGQMDSIGKKTCLPAHR